MTASGLETLATAVRFELVMRGEIATPADSDSGTVRYLAGLNGDAAESYIRERLLWSLHLTTHPAHPYGWADDARTALGEYETFLRLEGRAAA